MTKLPYNEALQNLVKRQVQYTTNEEMIAVGELAHCTAQMSFCKERDFAFDENKSKWEESQKRKEENLNKCKIRTQFCKDVLDYINPMWNGEQRDHDKNIHLIKAVDEQLTNINGRVDSLRTSINQDKAAYEQQKRDDPDGFGWGFPCDTSKRDEILKKDEDEQSYWLKLRWEMLQKMV